MLEESTGQAVPIGENISYLIASTALNFPPPSQNSVSVADDCISMKQTVQLYE